MYQRAQNPPLPLPELLGQVEQSGMLEVKSGRGCVGAWLHPQFQLQLLFLLQRLGLSYRIWPQIHRFEPILINPKSQGCQNRDWTELKLLSRGCDNGAVQAAKTTKLNPQSSGRTCSLRASITLIFNRETAKGQW